MKTLTNTESIIMKAIWEFGGPIRTIDLIESLRDKYSKDYARTTVTTFLERLKGKGYIETAKKGRISYITPLISKEDYLMNELEQTVEFWFDGDYDLALQLTRQA